MLHIFAVSSRSTITFESHLCINRKYIVIDDKHLSSINVYKIDLCTLEFYIDNFLYVIFFIGIFADTIFFRT